MIWVDHVEFFGQGEKEIMYDGFNDCLADTALVRLDD
jgi:hypothetical protein